jgi:molybdate transport repressor ModE-like protein
MHARGGCDVTLKQIFYFLRIAEAGSINKAAKRLGVAQSAMTRQLQLLEECLGSALFARGQGGVRLTEQGVALLPYAREISLLLDRAAREVSRVRANDS